MGKPNLVAFADTLTELASHDRNVIVVTSDSRGSGKLNSFGDVFPGQIIEVGIAEQNLVGMAAGLASTGKKVFAVSPASFLSARSLEQIKHDVCYSDNPVTLVGISAGVSYGALGSTHHSLHDIAVFRAIFNITVISPADNFETREAIRAAADMKSPVYLRFGKKPMPDLYSDSSKFIPGKANVIRDGSDVAFIANGETVYQAVMAADLLAAQGIQSRVISMHTVKPLDTEAVLKAAGMCRAIVTVEEHSVNGGLGEAAAGILMQSGIPIPFRIIGIPDEYTVTGSQHDIFTHYGISAEGLKKTALELLHE